MASFLLIAALACMFASGFHFGRAAARREIIDMLEELTSDQR